MNKSVLILVVLALSGYMFAVLLSADDAGLAQNAILGFVITLLMQPYVRPHLDKHPDSHADGHPDSLSNERPDNHRSNWLNTHRPNY